MAIRATTLLGRVGGANVRAAVFAFSRSRSFSSQPAGSKVCVVGAAGGIGQPLSLILKSHPLINELRVFDVAEIKVPATDKEPEKKVATCKGIASDLSHINTFGPVLGYGPSEMAEAFKGCDVLVIPAGVPRKPGMTRDDLFNTNATIVANIAKAVAKSCPEAFICIISNPVNSTVPIFAEILKKNGVFNPKRLLGVTALDGMRANTFYGEARKCDPRRVKVPVIGGHAGTTIVPLFSQAHIEGPCNSPALSTADIEKLTKRVMFGGDEVVAAKAGAGSATLSMALAGAQFVGDVLQGIHSGKAVETYAFVESKVTKAPFFASRLRLGRAGVEEVYGLGNINAYEQKLVNDMVDELAGQIAKGVKFVESQK